MGTDAILGPVKATVQVACGKRNDARETMKNFKEGNPAVLVARGAYHTAGGRREKGKELCKKGAKNTASIVNGVANGTPVVGHVKAGCHYALKDKEAGHKAMKSASRTTAGLVGAAAGLSVGLGPGAVAGYVAGVSAADGVISAADTKAHGEKRLHGNLAVWDEAIHKPSVGNAVEVVIGHTMDVLGGICVGNGLGEAMAGDGMVGEASTACTDTATVTDAPGGGDLGEVDITETGEPHEHRSVETGGEDLKFVGDEIKFARGVKKAFVNRLGPDGDGSLRALAGDVAGQVPDDLKVPELQEWSVGETPAERLENLALASKTELAKMAIVPDNKRDWVQDVA